MTISGSITTEGTEVDYWFDIGRMLRSESLLEALREEAEKRTKECIIQGYIQGELNCLWHNDTEIRGWWELK